MRKGKLKKKLSNKAPFKFNYFYKYCSNKDLNNVSIEVP